MSKEHKHHNSRIEITTALSVERALEVVRRTIETQSNLHLVGGAEGILSVHVKSWMSAVQISFVISAESEGDVARLASDILEYRTAQDRLLYIIPMGPVTMVGYKDYKRFMEALAHTVNAADPSARTQIIEQEAVGA